MEQKESTPVQKEVRRLVRKLRVLSTMMGAHSALAMLELPRLHRSRTELDEAQHAAESAISVAERLIAAESSPAADAAQSSPGAGAAEMNFLHVEEYNGGSPQLHKTSVSLKLHKTSVSLNQIVEQVMEDEAPRARLKRINLQADLDSGLPSVDLDIALISRSVMNLLDNALRHSPEGGVVRVETCRFADVVILRVRDHGPGVPADQVSGLFNLDGHGAKSASGSSTGLYLVRTIVEAHGGFVSATFSPDDGSAFVIILPCPPRANA